MTIGEIAKRIGMTPKTFAQIFNLELFDELEQRGLIEVQNWDSTLTKTRICRIRQVTNAA
jgi:hypothetical protein